MNKHNAKDYLPFVKALADGKMIQSCSPGRQYWSEAVDCNFDLPVDRYRIVEPTPTPTITPGKWRMRNGEVVTVKAIKNPVAPFVWISDFGIYSWDSKGILYASKTESGYDLISKVETRWRPWKAEEVPSGGWVRLKDNRSKRAAIVAVEPNSIGVGQRKVSYQQLFEECELLNHDGTYSPCGVEEEVG